MTEMLWTHSGDSHFIEPDDLWHRILPKAQADRMPRTTKLSDVEELVEVDGKSFTRKIPKIQLVKNRETGETIGEMSATWHPRCQGALAGPQRRGHLG
jgi:hypothetical protein